MPTLHRTVEAAIEEAEELLGRYRQKSVLIRKNEHVYFKGANHFPGFDAITHKERLLTDVIVAVVTERAVTLCDTLQE